MFFDYNILNLRLILTNILLFCSIDTQKAQTSVVLFTNGGLAMPIKSNKNNRKPTLI